MTIPKDVLHSETILKQFLSFLKRIELRNNNFVPSILLLDGRFENLWHALVDGKQGFKDSYTSLKVCVECVTSLVTKVSSNVFKVMA